MNNKYLGFGERALSQRGLGKEPANWENGLRLNPHRSSFEQWSVDSEFEDGTRITATFSTKRSPYTLSLPNPTVGINLTMPDGSSLYRRYSEGQGKTLNASREYCDVNISGSYLHREPDGRYSLYFIDDLIEYRAVISPTLPMWRPGTGHISSDNNGRHFAWLVAAPCAVVTATLRLRGRTFDLNGTGYMDHIWGNMDVHSFADHWYLCRGNVDGHTVICSDLVVRDDRADQNGTHISLMYAAKDGRVILDGSSACDVERSETFVHPQTKRFYDSRFDFTCSDRDGRAYTARFEHLKDIECAAPPTLLSRFFALFGKNHTRLCSVCDLSLSVIDIDGAENVFHGHGTMEQVSYTPLPQSRPGEYVGAQWPPEPADTEQIAEQTDAPTAQTDDVPVSVPADTHTAVESEAQS